MGLVTIALLCVLAAKSFAAPKWIAGCRPSHLFASDDGMSWTSAGINQPLARVPQGIAFSAPQGRWVVTGGRLGPSETYWSDDGLTWQRANPEPDCSVTGSAIAFSEQQNLWVLGCSTQDSAALLWYSRNGTSWSPGQDSTGNTFSEQVNAVAYSAVQDVWVAVGKESPAGTPIAKSSNGMTWQPVGFSRMFNPANPVTVGTGIVFSTVHNLWVAVGGAGDPSFAIYTSEDASTWLPASASLLGTLFTDGGLGVAVGGTPAVAIAVGQIDTVLRATNLTHGWMRSQDGEPVLPPFGVTYNPGSNIWVMVGGSSQSVSKMAYSIQNGDLWVNASISSPLTIIDCTCVAFRGDPVTIASSGPLAGAVKIVFVPADVSVSVLNNLVVGELTVAGKLSLGSNAIVVVQNDFVVAAQLIVAEGASVFVNGTFAPSKNSSLVVLITNRSVRNGSVSVAIVTFTNYSGSFGSVSARSADASCSVGTAEPIVSSSTLSVTVQLTCNDTMNQLSTGQIVGIVIGTVCGAVLVVLLVVLVTRLARKKNDRNANDAIRKQNFSELSEK